MKRTGVFLGILSSFLGKLNSIESCLEGNLSLSHSQQPGPLIGFGENIVDQFQTQFFIAPDAFINSSNQYFIDVVPSLLFGFTDSFSAFFTVPFAARLQSDGKHSSGMQDLYLQLEYAFFTKERFCSSDQATLVANATFPSGSANKTPPTGFGSYSYFLGATYNHTGKKWFFFTSYGALVTTTSHRTRFGNQYLYECGFGKNILGNPKGWLVAWMVEVDGIFFERNKIHGKTEGDSGGNVIYVTPSLWASTKRLIFQLGLGVSPIQNLFGDQPRRNFLISMNLGWSL